jgi:hypothetical protein
MQLAGGGAASHGVDAASITLPLDLASTASTTSTGAIAQRAEQAQISV